jgi:hypothetical protein
MFALCAALLAAQEVVKTYPPSDADIPNPERGLFRQVQLLRRTDLAAVAARGERLIHAHVSLADWRGRALPPSMLDTLGARFAAVREAGLKAVVRFVYDASEKGRDAPKARVLEHLAQLKPVLEANADVIAAMDAGFIGAWGEWHSSENGLDAPEARQEILAAILAALPKSRMVMVRTPAFARERFGDAPLPEAEAFSGSDRARIGHHNDCFLADADDMGTYKPGPVDVLKAYTETWTRHAVMSGETCRPSPRTEGRTALAELARFHWSMLHQGYHPEVIKAWKEQGVWEEIRRRLGYRFVLREAAWPASTPRGAEATLRVTLKNAGFASMYNERRAYAVFRADGRRHVAPLEGKGTDPRRWWGGEETSFSATVRVPAEPGAWRLSLWLPDAADALRDRPDYAVRFANEDLWDASTGENVLTKDFTVGP